MIREALVAKEMISRVILAFTGQVSHPYDIMDTTSQKTCVELKGNNE